MKLHLDQYNGNYFNSYRPGECTIQDVVYRRSIVVRSADIQDWAPQTFEDLKEADFEQLLSLDPEVILFGSGQRICFPNPRLTQKLLLRSVGFEVMDSMAACRTFNILAAENREVVAALILGDIQATNPPNQS